MCGAIFLAKIRVHFDHIHETIPEINAQEKVPVPGQPGIVVDYRHLLILERKGIDTYIPEGMEEDINVKELLNGVDTETKRNKSKEIPVSRRLDHAQIAALAQDCIDNNLPVEMAVFALGKVNISPQKVTKSNNLLAYFTNIISYLVLVGKIKPWLNVLGQDDIVFAKKWLEKTALEGVFKHLLIDAMVFVCESSF